MIIIIYFRQKVKIILNNNQSKQKIFFYNFFFFFKIPFYLRPVNTRGSNNVKEHKVDRKNGTYICGFHMYPKFIIKFLQILLTWAGIRSSLFNPMFKNI